MNAPEVFHPSTAHAVYSASSGHVWASEHGCTASATAVAAMRRVVPDEDSEASENGTAAHDELERVLGARNGEFVNPATMPILEVDPEHPAAFGVALMIAYIRKLPPGRMWVEQHVRLTDEIWGRSDIQHWHEESATLTILDLKNGFVGVDAEENEQTRIYAGASIKMHSLPAKWIRHVIVQPNDFRPVPRVKQALDTRADLDLFVERIVRIPHEPLTFRFGPHCRDCPLLGICPPTIDILVHFAAAMARGPVGDVQTAQIPIFLALKKPIDHFFEGLIKTGTKRALAGDIAPGMGLFTGGKHRVWLDEKKVRDLILAKKGVEGLKLPTPAQAEEMGIDVEGLAKAPNGGPVLGYANSKAKPYVPKSAAGMFGR